MQHHALVRALDSQHGSFLAELPPEARERLLADAVLLEVQTGATIFSAVEAMDRTGIVLRGMARTHLSSGDGRRLSVRFARSGMLIGSVTEGQAALAVQAVTACSVLELNQATLRELISADGRVGRALIGEIGRRLQETHATLASNTFGTMRERVARQLLEFSAVDDQTNRLVATVTQQELADGVGTVREVVARVLREFRKEGIISTTDGCIEILDSDTIATVVGRSRSHGWLAVPVGR